MPRCRPWSDSDSGKPTKMARHPKLPSAVFATRPLLDALRSFLASPLLATYFIRCKRTQTRHRPSGLKERDSAISMSRSRAFEASLLLPPWVDKSDPLCPRKTETAVHEESGLIADALRSQMMEGHCPKRSCARSWLHGLDVAEQGDDLHGCH